MAPPDHELPAAVRRAAASGFVQAAITLLAAGSLVFTLIDSGPRRLGASELALEWVAAVGLLAVGVLLIWGSIRLGSGRGRVPYLLGCGVMLVLCGYFLVMMLRVRDELDEVSKQLQTVFLPVPVLIAILPAVGIVQALGRATTGSLPQSTTD